MFICKKCKSFAIRFLPILTASLLSFGSSHSAVVNQNLVIDMSKPISAAQLAAYNRDGIDIDIDTTPVLRDVFANSRSGIIAHQLPSGAAKKIKNYPFGTKLEVIEYNKDWYGIRDRISRQYDEDNDGVIETSIEKWEKVYVKKSQTGTVDTIKLTPKDLNIVLHLSVGKKDEIFEAGKVLNHYLKVELIDKALFEKKRPLAVNFLSRNNAIKKRNGIITIPLAKDSLKLVDINSDDDGEIYSYIGQIAALDQHLVEVIYEESRGYQMLDQVKGHLTQEFSDYPYLSANKNYIISAYANPYEDHTDLELYKVSGKDVIPIMSAGYKNWMPTTNPSDIFWTKDGYLYLAVTHSLIFAETDGSDNAQTQYIRIKMDL